MVTTPIDMCGRMDSGVQGCPRAAARRFRPVSHEQPSSQKFGASEREPTEATVTISDAKPSQVVATDGGRVLENTTLPPASGPAGNSPISLDCSRNQQS